MKHLALPLILLLAGCVEETEAPGAALPALPPVAEDTCGANDYASLIGSPLAAVTLPADLNDRVIEPDSAVTMDFAPDRLNIYLDEAGTIISLSCG